MLPPNLGCLCDLEQLLPFLRFWLDKVNFLFVGSGKVPNIDLVFNSFNIYICRSRIHLVKMRFQGTLLGSYSRQGGGRNFR